MRARDGQFSIAALLIAALLIAACAQQASQSPTGDVTASQDAQKPLIKIGLITPLTGESAMVGENVRAGAEYAMAQLAKEDTKNRYELVVEDDAMVSANTITAYQKLRNVDGVKAVISVSSGSSNAIAPLAEQDRVLMCALASAPSIVAERTFVFKHYTTPEAEADRYVQEIVKLGWKRIVVLESIQDGTQALGSFVEERAKTAGIAVERHAFDMANKDARTELLKVKGEHFDAFLILLMPPHLAEIVQQVKEAGFTQPLTAVEAFEYIPDASLFEGYWYINGADATTGYVTAFEAATGKKSGFLNPHAYDCVNMLVTAFEQSSDSAQEAQVIHDLKDYQGAVGSLRYKDGNIESPAIKKMVKDGKYITVG